MSDIITGPVPPLRLEPGPPGARRLFLNRSLPDGDKLFEVVGGRLAPKRLSVYDTVTGNRLLAALGDHLRPDRSGHLAFGVLYDLPGAEDFYRPEVSFVPSAAWPRSKPLPGGEAWSVVPALVAEVVGRSRAGEDLTGRLGAYFRSGVRVVWVVRTEAREVHAFTSPTTVRVSTPGDELTGDPVVPGFRLPVADVFPLAEPAP